MRTTVTLDPDVERLLRGLMRDRGISFKEALNEAVRAASASPTRRRSRFVQNTYALGSEQYFRWDKALAAAESMQDEETVRKLTLRK
jgi:hypothetical protein